VPLNRVVAAQRFRDSTSAHTSETKGSQILEDNAKVEGADEQVTGEMERIVEGEEVTKVSCAHSCPLQLTPIHAQVAATFII